MTTTTRPFGPDVAPPRAGRREWLGLAALALPALLVAFDIGCLFLALPHLAADLGPTPTQQLWIMDVYGFTLAGFLLTMGTLGDRIGRRRLLLIGAAAFGAVSVLAAYARTAEQLILARALLGVAAATLGPSTVSLISTMFRDARERGLAIALWAMCMFGGAALGPVIGGVILEHYWWGAVFLLCVPVMVLLLAVGPVLLPEYRDPGAGRLDLASVALSLGAILPVVYGVKELAARGGEGATGSLTAVAAGLAIGVAFVRRQRALASPLLDLRLFGRPALTASLVTMLLASAGLAGTNLLTSQYLQTVLGLSPAVAGLALAPTGLGIAAGVLTAPALARRVRPVVAITGGLTVSALACLVLATGTAGGAWVVVPAIAVVAYGVGPVFVLGTGLVVTSAPEEQAGSAASVAEASNQLGSALGMALLGTVGTTVFAQLTTGMAASAALAAALFATLAATAWRALKRA